MYTVYNNNDYISLTENPINDMYTCICMFMYNKSADWKFSDLFNGVEFRHDLSNMKPVYQMNES